jgi:predicted ATP-grasp superfamily ATP-dependent carboligase
MAMIFDNELRAQVKTQRDAVHQLLKHHLPKCDLTLIGDSEISITYNISDYSVRSTALEATMFGDWQFVEWQDECNDCYHYAEDLNLDYTSNANDIVNALMKILKS